jgi:2-(1,2-epoxy-1,2-dihydrophenyl)acetyl-CoA isomerase
MSQPVTVEDQGFVRWITLDRPECKNGLNAEIARQIADAVAGATEARAIGITGKNGAFCSGLDLRAALEDASGLLARAKEHLTTFQDAVRAIAAAKQPVVAVVDGPAAGFGCDLALACDIRLASNRASFLEAFARIGLVPDGGGTWLLPRLIGLSKALELALLAEPLDAQTAKALGLVYRVVPEEHVMEEGRALLDRLAKAPPLALQRIKQLIRGGLAQDFTAGLRAEETAQLECLHSQDFAEGVKAFFQKRPGNFQGR